ncbi:SdpA family antimicrobial peptide system protein [Streptomyces xiaopingdaonensis]|uniref:SdpA family antimicrobial peptide system protein n=1 Tax=Streptomyces xiaopingdaonensis TaxID=1565415 RepID=UPI001ED939A4|nr:SdpA family antimicrobial peptide system protein [Streptomyces xiaopingdaonensis]
MSPTPPVWRASPPATTAVPRGAVWTAAAFVFLVALYGIHAHLPSNALTLPGESRASQEAATRVLPQGWAFFTKSPRDPAVEMYRVKAAGETVKLSATPHASAVNSFGLDRYSRAQGPEYAKLLERVPEKEWHKCSSDDPRRCAAEDKRKGRKVVNRTPSPSFCGDVHAVSSKPHPWAWRGLVDETHKAERSLHLSVTCKGAQR